MSANPEREAHERKQRDRLAASLRENLKRRKAQQRGRSAREELARIEPSMDSAAGDESAGWRGER